MQRQEEHIIMFSPVVKLLQKKNSLVHQAAQLIQRTCVCISYLNYFFFLLFPWFFKCFSWNRVFYKLRLQVACSLYCIKVNSTRVICDTSSKKRQPEIYRRCGLIEHINHPPNFERFRTRSKTFAPLRQQPNIRLRAFKQGFSRSECRIYRKGSFEKEFTRETLFAREVILYTTYKLCDLSVYTCKFATQ